MTGVSRAVLITGCSSGIGRATAARLADRGWTVYATARHPEDIEDLAARGCRVMPLDVSDEDTMRAAVDAVESEEGGIGVLVNNAGIGVEGAVEELDVDDVRREFETNLFGPLRLTQLVMPGMRRQHWGRIVNVSSVGGRITVPGGGAYHASKHAVEALSDALRFEVRGFGVAVIVIEPGAIESRWVEKAVGGVEAHLDTQSPYAAFDRMVIHRLESADKGVLRPAAGRPDAVARAIERAITTRRPRTRYVVPGPARLFTVGRRVLPDRAWDRLMGALYPTPRSD